LPHRSIREALVIHLAAHIAHSQKIRLFIIYYPYLFIAPQKSTLCCPFDYLKSEK